MTEPEVQEIPAVTELQFSKADFGEQPSTLKCAACQAAIDGTYFQLCGANLCAACGEKANAARGNPTFTQWMRGALFGFGGALAGAAIYSAIEMATGFTIGLVAILCGWLVGKSIRKGADGLGGRRCQVLAVGLTWFSITMGYLPGMIKDVRDSMKRETNNKASSGAPKNGEASGKTPLKSHAPAISLVILLGVVLVSPFLILFNGIGGIINAIILFFGLQKAWAMTGTLPPLSGPFSTRTETA